MHTVSPTFLPLYTLQCFQNKIATGNSIALLRTPTLSALPAVPQTCFCISHPDDSWMTGIMYIGSACAPGRKIVSPSFRLMTRPTCNWGCTHKTPVSLSGIASRSKRHFVCVWLVRALLRMYRNCTSEKKIKIGTVVGCERCSSLMPCRGLVLDAFHTTSSFQRMAEHAATSSVVLTMMAPVQNSASSSPA